MILNGLPVAIARWIADNKVYRPDFYSWIFVACYSAIYLIWLLAVGLVCSLIWGWSFAVLLLALMMVSGVFAYAYKGWWAEYRQQKKWQALSREKVSELKVMRAGMAQGVC
jgi:hypothetical protein